MRYIYSNQEGRVIPRTEYIEKYGEPQRSKPKRDPNIIVKDFDAYESPASGEVIATYAQRREDMARTGTIEYDPEMKTDAARRNAEADAALERAVEDTVEESFEKLDSHTKEKMANEITHSEVEIVRK